MAEADSINWKTCSCRTLTVKQICNLRTTRKAGYKPGQQPGTYRYGSSKEVSKLRY